MPLSEIESGKIVRIVKINGGRGFRQKLLGLGLIPGVPVKVIQRGRGFPVVLSVMGNRVMIGCGMAGKVMVK